MMNPVCVQCQTEMKVKDIGLVAIVEMSGNPPTPYRLWPASTHECPVCGGASARSTRDYPSATSDQRGFQVVLDSIPEERRVYSYEHRPAKPKPCQDEDEQFGHHLCQSSARFAKRRKSVKNNELCIICGELAIERGFDGTGFCGLHLRSWLEFFRRHTILGTDRAFHLWQKHEEENRESDQ